MKKWTKIIFAILVLALIFIWAEIAKSPNESANETKLYFFDVGQGDAELIQHGNYQILIDGGPDDKVLSELGNAMPTLDREIEVMVLTHPHADHITGLNLVLDRYRVDKIYYTGAVTTSNQYLEFLQKIKDKNIEMDIPGVGENFSPFTNGEMTFFWPGDKYKAVTDPDLNDTSETFKFCYFNSCAMYLGDLQNDGQNLMLESAVKNNFDLSANILKVAHHGSENGTNQSMLSAIKPTTAVIEVGANNQYGHPHKAALDLLNANNIKIFRTDRDGTIKFDLTESGIE